MLNRGDELYAKGSNRQIRHEKRDMKTLGQKVMQIEGLLGTKDISEWQEDFIQSVVDRTQSGKFTSMLSTKQIDVIEQIYNRHFA